MRIDSSIGFVGAGNMAEALIRGLLRGHCDAARLGGSAPRPERCAELQARYGITMITDNGLCAERSEILVLSVKPQIMRKVLDEIADRIRPDALVVSIAAGVPIAAIEGRLRPGTRVVRAMPNTPASIGRAMTVCAANACVTAEQRILCGELLSAVGEVEWVADEALMDAVTAVSGSGPAYVFLLAECLAEAGRAQGLDAALADRLARATVSGAGELLHRSQLESRLLRENVTSPGGTTAAALAVLMREGGLQSLLTEAVAAATGRSRELAK